MTFIKTAFKFDPNSTENEGRWRLRSPKIYSRFWRKKDKDNAGISYVMGKEKRGDKKVSIQAIRFNKKKWTEKEAANWWNKNKSKAKYRKEWTEADWKKDKEKKSFVLHELIKLANSLDQCQSLHEANIVDQITNKLFKSAADKFVEADHDWNEVLIDKDGVKKTRGQIKDYYKKNGSKLLPYLKDKDVIVLLGVSKNKTVLKRNIDGGKKIHITKKDGIDDPNSLEYWINRRAIEFHPALGPKTNLIWVDLDPKTEGMRSEAQKLTSEVASVMKKVFPNVKTKVWDSGKRGFHVEGHLPSEISTDEARQKLKEALDTEFENNDDVTTGLAKGNQIRLDTTTLKNTGSIRAPYSFSVNGRPKTPLNENSADDDEEFIKEPMFIWKKNEGLKEWTTYYKNFKGQVNERRDRFDAKIFVASDENHDKGTQYKEFAAISKEETPTGKGLELAKKWIEETIKIQEALPQQCRNCKKMYKGLSKGWYEQFCSPFCKKRFDQKKKLKLSKADDYFPPISFMKLKKIKTPEDLLKKYNAKDLAVQPKIDGFKIMATKDGDDTKLLTRRGKDVSANVPEIVEELNKYLPHGTTILGEMTVLADGQSISETQTLLGSKPGADIKGDVVYYVYDILEKDGNQIAQKPWQERNQILHSLLKNSKHLKLVETYTFEQRDAALKKALAEGGEGIVIKVKTAPYLFKAEGESEPIGEWFKFKPGQKAHTEDVFLDKYTLGEPDPKGHRKAVFPAYQFKDGKPFEVGKLSGMDRNTETSIKTKIDNGEKVIAEVSYQERMPSGKLRHMGWVRLRPDKPLKSVVIS